MRQLSPRDIRLTSPRMLTPRMSAKLADLELPSVSRAAKGVKPGRSPLGEAFKPEQEVARPNKEKKTSLSAPPSSVSHLVFAPGDQDSEHGADLSRPTWPAVPFVKLSGSPGSPSSVNDLFTHGARPTTMVKSSMSPETTSRMQMHATAPSGEWTPSRPVRPPSPNIAEPESSPRTIDPYVLETLRSPQQAAAVAVAISPAASPGSPGGGTVRTKQRSNSISLKGLKHMGSRTFHRSGSGSGKEKHVPPPLPLGNDAVGLFRGPVTPTATTFPGLRGRSTGAAMSPPAVSSAGGTSEFGAMASSQDAPTSASSATAMQYNSLPSQSHTKGGFGRLFNPFGRRTSDNGGKKATSKGHSPNIDSHANAQPHIMQISSPLPSSFAHAHTHAQPAPAGQSPGSPLRLDNRATVPQASPVPTSPRSIKRKLVPGADGVDGGISAERTIKDSISLGSMASFVLEDPPRRRVAAVQRAV